MALLIAVVGVAGVLAFSVSARTREFGVRLAIGSSPRHLLVRRAVRGHGDRRARNRRRRDWRFRVCQSRRQSISATCACRARCRSLAAALVLVERRRPRLADARRQGITHGRAAGAPIGVEAMHQSSGTGAPEMVSMNNESTARRPLRLWPGVIVVVLQWFFWVVVPIVPAFGRRGRVRRPHRRRRLRVDCRRVVAALQPGALGRPLCCPRACRRRARGDKTHRSPVDRRRHDGNLIFVYAIPVMSLAVVAGAVAGRRLSDDASARGDGGDDPARHAASGRCCGPTAVIGAGLAVRVALVEDSRRTAAGAGSR